MSNAETYPRRTVSTDDQPRGRLRRAWDTLSDTVRQPVETVTRSATLQTASGDVADIDPPEDIDELYQLYEEIGLIRASMNQFVSDVTEPGARVEAEDDATAEYFNGGDNAPDSAPEGGFLSECFVTAEKRQPFVIGLKMSVLNRWVRGTVLVELLKADPDDAESIFSGFKHIRPETVSARTYDNTNELVDPEDTKAVSDDEVTRREEAAAWVQYDEQSILGRRVGGIFANKTSVPLSQNDVLKQTLDLDIGGDDPESGVFGTSILRAVKDDAEEYRSIKRDQATAVKGKAWGLWTAQFNDHVIETDRHSEIVRWGDDDIAQAEKDIENLGPGSTLTTDAKVELTRHDGDVPDLKDVLDHYVDDILAPLPAPKYAVGFEENINQFVTDRQENRYERLISEERDYQERVWTGAFREHARRHDDLDPEGLTLKLEPEQDASPIMSLDMETIEKIERLAKALNNTVGQGESVMAAYGPDTIRELVVQLPDDVEAQDTLAEAMGIDEDDPEVQAQFDRLVSND